MNTQKIDRSPLSQGAGGFSLLEVLIAVVVLATGLLALAALQGSLARNASDARLRSEAISVAEIVTERLRADGFDKILEIVEGGAAAGAAWLAAEGDAAALAQGSAATYAITIDGESIDIGSNKDALAQLDVSVAWSDAAGANRNVVMSSLVSAASLEFDKTHVPPDDTMLSITGPVVKRDKDKLLTDGMIPIAIGDSTDVAATNPRPALGGDSTNQTLPSTSYVSLTYATAGNLAIMQQRIETQVVQCTCKMGGGTATALLAGVQKAAAFRPTYWDGSTYVPPAIASASVTTGPYINPEQDPKKTGVQQSPQCAQCCRDHHDAGTSEGDVLFDPISGDFNRYQAVVTIGTGNNKTVKVDLPRDVNGNPTWAIATGSDIYINACRVIRTSGFWRVATNLNSEFSGLLATTPYLVALEPVPYGPATASYEDFAQDLLDKVAVAAIGEGAKPDPKPLYASYGLDDPLVIGAGVNDQRYLHSRGLYLDHLEDVVLAKLKAAYPNCPTDSEQRRLCLLPYLPFTTINVSELALWRSSAANILTLGEGPLQKRGVVHAKGNGTADALMNMGKSNSAVVSSLVVNPYENDPNNIWDDAQQFVITGTSVIRRLFLNLLGLSQTADLSTNNDPRATLQVTGGFGLSPEFGCAPSYSRTKTDPNAYECVSTQGIALPVYVTLGRYNLLEERVEDNPCGAGGEVSRPYLVCNTVDVTSSILNPAANVSITVDAVTSPKGQIEQTTIKLSKNDDATLSLADQSRLEVRFLPNGEKAADFQCDLGQPIFTTPTACN